MLYNSPVTHRSSFAIPLSISLHSSLPIAIQLAVDITLVTSVRPQRRRRSIHIRCLLIQRGIMNTIYDYHSSHLTPSVYAFHNVVFHLAVVTIRRFIESTFPGIRYSHLTAYLFNITSTLLFSVLPASAIQFVAIQLVAIQLDAIQIVAIHLCIISHASTSAFAFPPQFSHLSRTYSLPIQLSSLLSGAASLGIFERIADAQMPSKLSKLQNCVNCCRIAVPYTRASSPLSSHWLSTSASCSALSFVPAPLFSIVISLIETHNIPMTAQPTRATLQCPLIYTHHRVQTGLSSASKLSPAINVDSPAQGGKIQIYGIVCI
jgi:hypothetical protein